MDLHTTNELLGVMAGVSLLEALLLIVGGVAAVRVYRRVMQLVADLEAQQIAPIRAKVDAILVDVKAITARVSQETERMDRAITGTIDRVDTAAEHVRRRVRDRIRQVVGVAHGVRAVIMWVWGHGTAA